MYNVTFSPKAYDDVKRLQKRKHRLVYRIFETEVQVEVLAAYGHYDDK